jgi:hypothetical protein
LLLKEQQKKKDKPFCRIFQEVEENLTPLEEHRMKTIQEVEHSAKEQMKDKKDKTEERRRTSKSNEME